VNLQSPEMLINVKSVPDITSVEYNAFWKNEVDKIRDGVTINGYTFSPFLYWHLNLWSIYRDEEQNGRIMRTLGRPQFWDSMIEIDDTIRRAESVTDPITGELSKKGVLIVGSRRISKTVFGSSYNAHKLVAYKGSEVLISALNQPDIKVITDYMDLGLRNLPDYLRFSRIEDDWKKGVTLGFKDKKTNLRNEWSKVHIRNFDEGNNTEAAAGLTLSGAYIDEVGKGKWLNCFSATTPCFDSPYGWRCSPIATATGGDMKKATEAQQVFYNPEAYNFLAVTTTEENTKVSLFIPGTKSLRVPREEKSFSEYLGIDRGSELDTVKIWVADEDRGKALIASNRDQKKKAEGMEAYLKEVMYYPLTPEECFLDVSENIFPVDLLQQQLMFLESNALRSTPVELYRDIDGTVKHKFTDKKPVNDYPADAKKDNSGVVQIWEFPKDNAPIGLYTAGCLPPGEKVLTDKGMMNIEDVTMDEKLISKDGNYVDIYSLERYYLENAPNFEVKVSNTFRRTTFTEEHPIYINHHNLKPYQINDNTEFDFKEVKYLKEKDWIKVPNFYRNNSIKEIDLDTYWGKDNVRIDRKITSPLNHSEFWWLIGYYLGDGWVTKNKISFSVNKQESYYLKKLKTLTEKYLERSSNNERERSNAVEYTINSEELSNFLTSNFKKYASGKNIPEWVKYLPEEYKIKLISGYLASDGCITKHSKGYGSVEFVSISLELLEAFQDILFSLGIVSNLSKLRERGKMRFRELECNTKECYHLRMGNGSTINLIEKINDPLDPKIQKVNLDVLKSFGKQKRSGCFMSGDLSHIYFQVTEIKVKLFTGIVYNFHCETNTFMCHHITTHNTDPYKQAQAVYSTSLGCTYIYKRMHNIGSEGWQNMVVACYCGRPKKLEEWFENTKLLLEYYNAKTLCENEDMIFIRHCIEKNEAHKYLERTPKFLTDIHPNTTVSRDYGIHMTTGIKEYLVGLLIAYINQEIGKEVDDQGNVVKVKYGASRILDPLLIKEMIKFNYKANTDRVISAGLALAMAGDLNTKLTVSSEEDSRYKDYISKTKKSKSPFRSSTFSPFKRIR
jgi:intein/homing endonuclease